MKWMTLLVVLALQAEAKTAPQNMTQFNHTCPAPALCDEITQQMDSCKSKHSGCSNFVVDYKRLLPEYDCQRSQDHTAKQDYVVPAIWLCSNQEALLKFLAGMKFSRARKLFGSPELRSSLDGDLAEQYYKKSMATEAQAR